MKYVIFLSLVCCQICSGVVITSSSWTRWSVEDGGNGNAYRVVVEADSVWNTANNTTNDLQNVYGVPTHLVTITSTAENVFVQSLCDNVLTDDWNVWLGGYCMWPRQGIENEVWCWTSDEVFVYTNWNAGQPSGLDYLAMSSNGGWFDATDVPFPNTISGYVQEVEYVPEPLTFCLLLSGIYFLRRKN